MLQKWKDQIRKHCEQIGEGCIFKLSDKVCSLHFRGGRKLGGNDIPVIFQETENNSTTYYNETTESRLKAASDKSAFDDSECYTENLEIECSSDTENVEKSKTIVLILIPWTAALFQKSIQNLKALKVQAIW